MESGRPGHDCNPQQGRELLDRIVLLFADLLATAGATRQMISDAMTYALQNAAERNSSASFTELGSIQRDCMEVMCAWRRDASLVDTRGDPKPLELDSGENSFKALCLRAGCEHNFENVLEALLDFGAVALNDRHMVVSRTPTFLLTRRENGGRLATDGLLKQLEGYLRTVHRNVRSVSGSADPRFERACTVSIAVELEPIFAQMIRNRGQEFVDSIDEWLERNARRRSSTDHYVELGLGVYYIELGQAERRAQKSVPSALRHEIGSTPHL